MIKIDNLCVDIANKHRFSLSRPLSSKHLSDMALMFNISVPGKKLPTRRQLKELH